MSIEFHVPVSYDADVIVVGAGPAGASTAWHLARAGFEVLLLDSSAFPRDKVCGDFVGPVALRELAELGITPRPDFQRTNKVVGATLFLDGKSLVTRTLPAIDGLPAFGRVIPRVQLDNWIREAALSAGARFRSRIKAVSVETDNQGVVVKAVPSGCDDRAAIRFRARVVVGADGSNSKIARSLRTTDKLNKKDRIVAVRAYYSGVAGPGDRCDMYFSEASFPGYYWLFPTSASTANVGLGMVMETTPPTDGHLRTLLLNLIERDPALRERLGGASIEGRVLGWPLSTYNHRSALVGDGMILVGDAAGLINPLNGEGIQYALLSARWAAETIGTALRAERGLAGLAQLRPYERRVAAELRPEMALATTIVSLIRRRDMNAVWLQALRLICARATIDQEYGALAGGILAGITPASAALSRQVLGGTARQAVRTAIAQGARTALSPRARLRSLIHDVSETAGTVVGNSAQDPVASALWAADVALALFELATQTVVVGPGRTAQSSRSTM